MGSCKVCKERMSIDVFRTHKCPGSPVLSVSRPVFEGLRLVVDAVREETKNDTGCRAKPEADRCTMCQALATLDKALKANPKRRTQRKGGRPAPASPSEHPQEDKP